MELHVVSELTGPLSPYFSVSTLSFLCRSGVKWIVDYNLFNFTIKLCSHDSIHTGFILKDVVDVKINSLFSNSNIQSLFLIYQISINQFISLFHICSSIHPCIHLSSITHFSFHPPIYPYIHTFIYHFICLHIYPSVHASIYPFLHLSIHSFFHPYVPSSSIHVSICHL